MCKHKWPEQPNYGTVSSQGAAHIFICNDCIAVKVTYDIITVGDERFLNHKEEHIVEPTKKAWNE